MLDDLGAPSSCQVARALRVSIDQVEAWRESDQAPHAVCLALFWLTRWGMSLAGAELVNAARLAQDMAAARLRECERLRAELARVVNIGDFGCANAPTLTSSDPVRVSSWRRA